MTRGCLGLLLWRLEALCMHVFNELMRLNSDLCSVNLDLSQTCLLLLETAYQISVFFWGVSSVSEPWLALAVSEATDREHLLTSQLSFHIELKDEIVLGTSNLFHQLSTTWLLVPGVALQDGNSKLTKCKALSFFTFSSRCSLTTSHFHRYSYLASRETQLSSTLHPGRSRSISGQGDNMTEYRGSKVCLLPVR